MDKVIDLTTPQGLFAEECRLEKEWGEHVSIGVCSEGALVYLAAHYQHGLDDVKFFRAPTFAKAIVLASDYVVGWKTQRRETITRKMALAIIEVTDEHTECTARLLRGKKFSDEQITEYKEAACIRASEMCGNSPFVVLP